MKFVFGIFSDCVLDSREVVVVNHPVTLKKDRVM